MGLVFLLSITAQPMKQQLLPLLQGLSACLPSQILAYCCLLSDQKLCELNAEHPYFGSLVSGVVAQGKQDTARVFSCQVGNANLCHQTVILDVNVFMWSPPCAFSPLWPPLRSV